MTVFHLQFMMFLSEFQYYHFLGKQLSTKILS